MIILEGPDLGGKTTIGAALSAVTGRKMYHAGTNPKTYHEAIARINNSPDAKTIIFDRHICISEQVYGFMRGRTPVLYTPAMDAFLITHSPLVFFCYPGDEHLLANLQHLKTKSWKSKEHVEMVRENYLDNLERYKKVMDKISTFCTVHTVDFKNINKDDLLRRTNEYLRL